ncbi:MAG: sulfotransferase family 2 domain-containing protein, partial [Nitrospinales bacterium]
MLITDQFVMLNLPKTGSTFARNTIKKAYSNSVDKFTLVDKLLWKIGVKNFDNVKCKELLLPSMFGHRKSSQHGTYIQIPAEHKHKDIYAVIRNPYTRFISGYQFRLRKKNPGFLNRELKAAFPNFPNLSIDEYIDFVKLEREIKYYRTKIIPHRYKIGNSTIQFIFMFFKDPYKVLKIVDANYIDNNKFVEDIANINFLRHEELNHDLYRMLSRYNFKKDEID